MSDESMTVPLPPPPSEKLGPEVWIKTFPNGAHAVHEEAIEGARRFVADDWERIARGLVRLLSRCDKGQCLHPYTATVRVGGSHTYVCDECARWFDDPEPEERSDAALIREAWKAVGGECRYCQTEPGEMVRAQP